MDISFVSTTAYVAATYALSLNKAQFAQLYQHNTTYKRAIMWFSLLHNLALAVFSGYTVYALLDATHEQYHTYNVIDLMHNYTKLHDGQALFLCRVFAYSKVYEFLDTFLVMLKGQDTIFLQKYHHFGAVWVWFMTVDSASPPIIMTTLFNACVHTVMYLYYFCCVLKIQNRRVKVYITSMQLLQLISGVVLTCVFYVIPRTHLIAQPELWTAVVFQLYVCGLIVMFSRFYYDQYIRKVK